MITLKDVQAVKDIQELIQKADDYLGALGFTDHGMNHIEMVTKRALMIADKLTFTDEEKELVGIAAYMHDIGNITGRQNHSIAGSIMAFQLLRELHMDITHISKIMTAIANHDENNSEITDTISAVLIIADKSDVRQSRVREKNRQKFDIHDRVNFAVQSSSLIVINGNKEIWLNLEIDTSLSPMMDYFEIFLSRMLLSKKAAQKLGYHFHLKINSSILA
ncbi:MAG: HD domain-containing protein [Caldisericia bacterium]|nr:HD domain-containing protein [Caldisericia bacterium]MDD4613864.1 HD domain-containing protein [Caldisericia bacterium]